MKEKEALSNIFLQNQKMILVPGCCRTVEQLKALSNCVQVAEHADMSVVGLDHASQMGVPPIVGGIAGSLAAFEFGVAG